MCIYRFLFCFSTGIEKVINSTKNYCIKMGYKLSTDLVNTEVQLNEVIDLKKYDAIILQQYFNPDSPINVEYIHKLSRRTNANIISIFEEEKRKVYSKELFRLKLYNCFFGNDLKNVSVEQFFILATSGRSKDEAEKYYDINKKISSINYAHIISDISYMLSKYNDEEYLIKEVDAYISELSDMDIRYILTEFNDEEIKKLICIPRFYKCYNSILNNMFLPNKSSKFQTISSKLLPLNCKNVGVVSLSKCSGSTFLTINLACAFDYNIKISVIENPLNEPYLYTYLGLNTNIYDEDYSSTVFTHTVEDNIDRGINFYNHSSNKNVTWILKDATRKSSEKWDSKKLFKLIFLNKKSYINIVDIGHLIFDDNIYEIIDIFNILIVVIDPMVPDLLNNSEMLEKFKELENKSGIRIIYVVNKFNKGVDKRELLKFLNKKPASYIPYINPEMIYKSVYNCAIPYNYKAVKKELFKPLNKIIKKHILSNDFDN